MNDGACHDPWAEIKRLRDVVDSLRINNLRLIEDLDEAYKVFCPAPAPFHVQTYTAAPQMFTAARVSLQSRIYQLAFHDIELKQARDPRAFVRGMAERIAKAMTANLADQCEYEIKRITGLS